MGKLFANRMNWLNFVKTTLGEYVQKHLYENLINLTDALRMQKKQSFNRFLPLSEYFGDRWGRAAGYGFGEGSSIYDSAVVIGDVKVGQNTWIGPNTLLDGSGRLSIGSFCSISAGVQLYSHDSVDWATSGGQADYRYAETSIGDNTYIGPNSIVTKGVRIGRGCIVGAQSFVNADVADGKKVVGSPARLIIDTSDGV